MIISRDNSYRSNFKHDSSPQPGLNLSDDKTMYDKVYVDSVAGQNNGKVNVTMELE